MIKRKIGLVILFLTSSAWAREERQIGQSPRALLMGDAYTAIADDDFTLFYNPAILARHKGLSFWPLNTTITIPNAIGNTDQYTNISDDATDFADSFMNENIHLGLNAAPGLKMEHFGLTAIVDFNMNFLIQNKVTPTLVVDHRYDKGFITGVGIPLSGSYSKSGGGEQLSMGVSLKYISRESIDESFPITSTTFLDALGAGDTNAVLSSLGLATGVAWGMDFGLDWVKGDGNSTTSLGVSILDPYTVVNDTTDDSSVEVMDQPMRVNLGAGYKMAYAGLFDLTLSLDIRSINKRMEFTQRVRSGIELGMPGLSILAGYNSGYYSYGIKTDLLIFKLYLGYFDVEIGESFKQQKDNRFVLYLSLFDFTFEP